MKKFGIILLLFVCLFVAGCGKEKAGAWEATYEAQPFVFSDEVFETMNKAFGKLEGEDVEPIVLLGTQVVEGTNYMFLCKEKNNDKSEMNPDDYTYQVVTVYKDLNGEASVTEFFQFRYDNYLENKETTYENLVGGWTVNPQIEGSNIDYAITSAFEKAVKKDKNITYVPMFVLAKQKEGKTTNYAMLVQQKENEDYSFQVIVFNFEKEKVLTKSYVSLTDFKVDLSEFE